MQETQETSALSLSLQDPPEQEMAAHASIPAWEIPRTKETWWATVHGVAKSCMWLTTSTME